MPDPLKTELPHHAEAFERFWGLGDIRTYAILAQQAGLDLDTIKLWGRSFGWMRRVEERRAEVARALADKHFSDQVEHSERNLRIVRAALARLAKAIATGDIKPRLMDIERLMRLEEHLLGLGVPKVGDGSRPGSAVRIYLPDNSRDGYQSDDE